MVRRLREEVRRLPNPSSSTADSDEDVEELVDDGDAVFSFFPKKKDKVDEVEAFQRAPSGESLEVSFRNLPKLREVFIRYNTGVPSSAASERLFSVGKDAFTAKRNRLSDINFERLLLCRINRRFCPGI